MESATTPQLLGYMRVLRERGVADVQITQKLIAVGWDPAIIQEGLHQLAAYEQVMGGAQPKPLKAPGFLWGAFFLSFFWGVAHKQRAVWWTLVPVIGFFVCIVLSFQYGFRGMEIARKSGKYASESACITAQYFWNRMGWSLMIVLVLLSLLVLRWLDSQLTVQGTNPEALLQTLTELRSL